MKKRILAFLPCLALLAVTFANIFNNDNEVVRDDTILVELKDTLGTGVEERKTVEKRFINELNVATNFNYRIVGNYKYAANVLTLEVNKDDLSLINSLDYVETVSEVKTYSRSEDYETNSYNSFTDTMVTTNYSRVDMNYPNSTKDGSGTIMAIMDDSFNVNHEMFKDISSSTAKYSQSDIQSLEKTTGFVGKSAGYKDNKIPFYYSYYTNDTNMTYNRNTEYHGGHVSGIAGANNTIKGAAPNAQLALMRLTDNNGNFKDTAIMSALEDCAILRVDCINMSFGNSYIDFNLDTTLKSVFNKLQNSGISVDCAAGNDGRDQFDLTSYQGWVTSNVETGELGYFSSTDSTTAVGSLNVTGNENIITAFSLMNGNNFRVRDNVVDHQYSSSDGTNGTQIYEDIKPFYEFVKTGERTATLSYEIVPNLGDDKDYLNIDVKGKVAVVSRGTTTFSTKLTNAKNHGAIAILIYDNVGATSQVGYFDLRDLTEDQLIPAGYISSTTGDLLKEQTDKRFIVSKELSSDFSSDGSTSDLTLNPIISTPGQSIFSGVGPANTTYAFYSGTSMAAPNYTGAYATILSDYSGNDVTSYKSTLTARIMSTANPVQLPSGAYYSPRKVGAGEVDVKGAVNSEVYLDGGSKNRAKIELKNNEDIAKGNVKLSVNFHNESTTTKKYKATVYVQAPDLTTVDTVFGDLANYNYAQSKDLLLTTSTSNIDVVSGDSTLNFNCSITDDNKKYLDSNFENGTYLEGYVIFESLDTNGEDLSIPYLGFYGDYSKEMCVEDFSFEKTGGTKVYGSDIINSIANENGYTSANYHSMFRVGTTKVYDGDYNNIYNRNVASLANYGREATYTKYNNQIILGATGLSTYVAIQQFVNRNVIDNTITLTSSSGEIVYTGFMQSALTYSSTEKQHNLIRSGTTKSWLGAGYIADRGFTQIALVDKNGELLYPEGDYVLKFSYDLAAGYTQTKTYNIKISKTNESDPPVIINREIVTVNNQKYLRIRYNGSAIKSIYLNNTSVEISHDDTSYYYDIILDGTSTSTDSLTITDGVDKSTTYLIYTPTVTSDGYGLISSEDISNNSLSVSKSDLFMNDDNNYCYEFDFLAKKDGIVTTFSKQYQITLNADSTNYEVGVDKISVYEISSDGSYSTQISYDFSDNLISCYTKTGKIRVEYTTKKAVVEPSITNSVGVVIGLIIGGVAIFIGLSIALVIIFALKEKK